MPPHTLPFAALGAGVLRVGWFGFNAGSAPVASPTGALGIRAGASLIAFWAVTVMKPKFGYGDSLDVFGVHRMGVIYTMIWSSMVSWVLLKVLDKTTGLCVADHGERVGLDLSDHYETAYTLVD